MLAFHLITFMLTFLCFTTGMASEHDQGTLLVSYSTGERAERLNRVRFSLIAEDNTEQMYPKGDAFVEGIDALSRMVVIENVPIGAYKLRFLIPNTDKLFENIRDQKVQIIKNKVIRIDQELNPRYATLRIKTQLLPVELLSEKPPELTLEDPHGDICAHSVTGKLVSHYLLPGRYSIKFGTLEGFHPPEDQCVNIAAGDTLAPIIGTYICEGFHPDSKQVDQQESKKEPSEIAEASFARRRYGGTVIINQVSAQLTVTNNLPTASWTLLRNNVVVYEGVGSVTNLQVLDSSDFQLIPEEIDGYVVRVSPGRFSLFPTQTMRASIAYELSTGTFTLKAPFPEGDTLTFTLTSAKTPSAAFKVKSNRGEVFWQSPPLPVGNYKISYDMPSFYAEMPPEIINIQNGSRKHISPKFYKKNALRLIANIPEAVFLLTSVGDSKVLKGEGREFTFIDIPPGMYKLTFSTNEPSYFIPPKEMKFSLGGKESKEMKATFQIAAKLTVKTNIDRSNVVIQEIGGRQKKYQEKILNHSKVFTLPEGRYKITLSSVAEDRGTTVKLTPPDPIEINLKSLNSEELNLSFLVSETPQEKQRKLNVSSDLSNGGFSVFRVNERGKELIGHYTGKNVQLALPSSADLYEVVYDDIPNYDTPKSETIEIKAGEQKNLQADYTPIKSFIYIPAGRAIIGDQSSEQKINVLPAITVTLSAFSIGVYEITNAEFADWLNKAIKSGSISYIKEADRRGQVINMKDQLLFKTFEADSFSQISAQLQSTDAPSFMSFAGNDSFPVINVTWFGAQEYCKDNQCRLPTEAEWEKAAGMDIEKQGKPLKKFRFGFGQDTIDKTWANYKDNTESIQHFKVMTTPVGFYNGTNTLPLRLGANQQQTHLAKSPYGAFDMSGNVWEWVSDWFDGSYYANMPEKDPKGPDTSSHKVVKGGCYDSLADGVRVSERMGLPLDYCDAYTGFRVAK